MTRPGNTVATTTATGERAAPAALPVHPTALAQRISQLFRRHAPTGQPAPVLVNAEPTWPYDPILPLDGNRRVRVVPCPSVLAVWDQLTTPHDEPLVLLTGLSQHELGVGVISQVFRRQLVHLDPWDLVADCFGARRVDSRLLALRWAGAALVEAMPPRGWPRLSGSLLERDTALRHLASERLDLARLGMGADDLDLTALLWWSRLPGAPANLTQLGEAERTGLLTWLVELLGAPVRALTALLAVDRAADALPLGLVCAALWSEPAQTDPDALRAQGRVEQYFGNPPLPAPVITSFGHAATRAMVDLLATEQRHGHLPSGLRLSQSVLDRAEELLLMFAVGPAAQNSQTLRYGFEHRLGEVATALTGALRTLARHQPERPDRITAALATCAEAVDSLEQHHLAGRLRHRVDRARMAARLVRWLAVDVTSPTTVRDGIDQHVAQWGWVDLAVAHVWTGDDGHAALARAYRAVYQQVRDRRRELDRHFAERLRDWTRDGSPTGGLLTVETVLDRVVAPVVQEGSRPVLLVVVDGMSAAVAADLGEELAAQSWVEYDPLGGAGETVRRRGAVAALPTVTTVSRTSLLTASLTQGTQDTEVAAFRRHRFWRGRQAELFPKNAIHGEAGEVLSTRLVEALNNPDILVGVIVNTVDDALDHGRESADAGWRLDSLGPLRALLDQARYQGRAVIITSDHGHVLERDGSALTVDGARSARHRTDDTPPVEGEVELTGPRVLADGQRIVALWDPHLRYLPRRAGYHGGASLAEVTVPLLALLPLGAAAPAGWRPVSTPHPTWWNPVDLTRPHLRSAPPAAAAGRVTADRGRRKPRPTDPAEQAGVLFDLPQVGGPAETDASEAPGNPVEALVDRLLAGEIFQTQQTLTPRKMPRDKVRGALLGLLDNNGVLPAVVVAERAGEQPGRAVGFVTTLQRILNVENFPVLSLVDDGRTVRLDVNLLCEQFGVPVAGR